MSEMRPAVKNRRTIVSVPFPSDQFQALCLKAKAEGKSLSAYIRDKALEGVSKPTIHLLVDGEQVYVSATR